MTRDLQSLAEYLGHIGEAVERIQSYIDDMEETTFICTSDAKRVSAWILQS
jgi:uncharacterized protein with HEPN domain